MWCEKIFYAIVCNVFDIEKLEKLKAEKTVRVEKINRSLIESPSNATYKPIDTKDQYHLGL